MKNKRIILFIVLSIVVIGGIGGAWYMKREKDLAELHDIQTDLANYLYNNYRLYTRNVAESNEIKKLYNNGNGSLSEEEYLKKMKETRVYSDIKKVEFTKFSVGPMKGLVVNFKINDVYSDNTTLSTISAETGKWKYSFNSGNNRDGYVLEKKENQSEKNMPEEHIIYNYKGVE